MTIGLKATLLVRYIMQDDTPQAGSACNEAGGESALNHRRVGVESAQKHD